MEWLSISDVGFKKFTSAGKREVGFYMSFEEDFPSLKTKYILNADGTPKRSNAYEGDTRMFLAIDIQKYCLDKEKVREKIMRLPNCDIRKYLLKEMGLC
jgi:hypothetical protein